MMFNLTGLSREIFLIWFLFLIWISLLICFCVIIPISLNIWFSIFLSADSNGTINLLCWYSYLISNRIFICVCIDNTVSNKTFSNFWFWFAVCFNLLICSLWLSYLVFLWVIFYEIFLDISNILSAIFNNSYIWPKRLRIISIRSIRIQ